VGGKKIRERYLHMGRKWLGREWEGDCSHAQKKGRGKNNLRVYAVIPMDDGKHLDNRFSKS